MTVESKVPGWTNDEEQAAKEAAYDSMLVDRYQNGLPLSKACQVQARRLIRAARKAAA